MFEIEAKIYFKAGNGYYISYFHTVEKRRVRELF